MPARASSNGCWRHASSAASAAEGLTAAALAWLGTGACTNVIPATTARAKPAGTSAAERYPLPKQPSPAQFWLPGVN